MTGTGIIRRVDEMGRIVLPIDFRRKQGITEGTPMEIVVTGEGILLKKYCPEHEMLGMAKSLMEEMEGLCAVIGPERAKILRQHIKDMQMLLSD